MNRKFFNGTTLAATRRNIITSIGITRAPETGIKLIFQPTQIRPQKLFPRRDSQLRDRIPRHRFQHTRPFHRVRIGQVKQLNQVNVDGTTGVILGIIENFHFSIICYAGRSSLSLFTTWELTTLKGGRMENTENSLSYPMHFG